jgi:hypothetical protein
MFGAILLIFKRFDTTDCASGIMLRQNVTTALLFFSFGLHLLLNEWFIAALCGGL